MVVDEQADLRLNYVADKIQIKIIKLTPQQQLKQNQSKSIRWCFALMFKTLHQYLFGFSALCILICLLKSPASLNHIDCICFTFLHCVFSNVSSIDLPERTHNQTGCISLTFLHCVFSYGSSKSLGQCMQSRIGCICLTFPHCVFLNVSSICLPCKRHSHTACTSWPVTYFRRSHKNYCIVIVFMILLHHYQVGSEETKAFPQHYQLTFSGHWTFKITFSWK